MLSSPTIISKIQTEFFFLLEMATVEHPEEDPTVKFQMKMQKLQTVPSSLRCQICNSSYKLLQLQGIQKWNVKPLYGDSFYELNCAQCGKEEIKRLGLSWIDVVSISLYNLTLHGGGLLLDGKMYFHWKSQICEFIESKWDMFWIREKSSTWKNSVASCLSTSPKFVSLGVEKRNGEQG
jgi:hypothetical protein